MKTVKADLSDEGRLDIVDKIKAYRGGEIASYVPLLLSPCQV